MKRNSIRILLLIAWTVSPFIVFSQDYFGQNKVKYDQFHYEVYNTPHFRIYYYKEESDAVKDIAQMSEIWYDRLSKIFNHQFNDPNPIILYASPEHFAQTDIIPGLLGEGVGGVTEGAKNRVIIPLTGSWRDNNHVLGHELVHAFQYDILIKGDSTTIRNITNMPLWFIEGLAEYLSIGSYDPQTAMWLRDAVVYEDFPTLKKMSNNYHYFPYRWGQSFWAYVGGMWGDEIIPVLYKQCAIYGYEAGIERTLSIKSKVFSQQWNEQVENYYRAYLNEPADHYSAGRRLFEDKKAIDEQDFAPSVSPNGKYVVFLSARNIFTLDLYLADARSRKIIRRLKTQTADGHGNAFRLIESAAAWSPDSKYLAFISYDNGDHYLNIVEASKGKTKEKILMEDVQSMLNTSWSPDGKKIVFSGVNQGSSDLYVYDMKTQKTDRLTDDKFSDLQASWSPDGKSIVFITDRFSGTDFSRYYFGNYQIGSLNLDDKTINRIPLFSGINHIDPEFGKDNKLYFIAAPDGVSNIYRYDFKTTTIERLTHEKTAIAGITELSPALSIASKTGDLIYSVFKETGYQLFSLKYDKIKAVPVDASGLMNSDAGELPPLNRDKNTQVNDYINAVPSAALEDSLFTKSPYKGKLSLSSISNAGIGVGAGPYGAGFGGAVNIIFSDMLEQNIVYGAIQASGSVQDIGGVVGYVNQKKRYSWGLSFSHIPYGYASYLEHFDTLNIEGITTDIYVLDQYILREFDDKLSVFAAYPLTRVNRIEGSLALDVVNYSYQVQRYNYLLNGILVSQEKFKLDAPKGFQFGTAAIAFVGDDSRFGFTSPLSGYRYRLEAGVTAGAFHFGTALADFRIYKYVKPVSFAFRAMHYGRYLGNADSSILSPLSIGYDYLVRGYNYWSFDPNECHYDANGNCIELNRLTGSKIGVMNFEVRFPLTGPRELAPIRSLALPTTLNFFVDGGIAWSGDQKPVMDWSSASLERIPVFSTGLSLRVNVFGYLVVEGYYAIPFQRPERNSLTSGVFGLLIIPGW